VIAGGQDMGATPEMAQQIAGRIPGAELQVFDEASHLSVAEVPEKFGAAVGRLLQRV
jgi:3-oxoadipate enol-lactonase